MQQGNERLEFLGDALLGAFVARFLLAELPPETPEGMLSRARVQVIRRETLAQAARELGLSDLLRVGQGERKEQRQTHDSLLADAYEALVAVQYLDRGEDAMEQFIRATLAAPLARAAASPPDLDPKTRLQEKLQAEGKGLPVYHTVSATGIGHDHHFVVEVALADGMVLGSGEGPNKRTAQTNAAQAALGIVSRAGSKKDS